MSTPKDGGQAFPRFNDNGMTLRDWFAGQALAGMMAHQNAGANWTPSEIAHDAYLTADTMLAARECKEVA
jgi:hypothetical protein